MTIASLAERLGGPSRVIPALAAATRAAGGDVTLVTRDDGSPAVAGVNRRVLGSVAAYGAAVGVALGTGPAVLHDHGLWTRANMAATGAARRRGRPYVVSVHGMLEPWALAHRGLRKRVALTVYEQRRLGAAAALVANAEPERATLRARFPTVPVATVPNGVAVPAATAPEKRDSGPATCLFMSRLHPVKNLLGLLQAWARVAADPAFDRWTLRIAGPDQDGYARVVADRIAALGLTTRVVLVGPVAEADKSAAFAAADLFVLPSFTENFGIVAAEALAHGVPVVAGHGSPWRALRDHRAGWWTATDPAALANTLCTAMALPAAERRAMGARGRDWVKASLGWPAIGQQMLGVYEWVLGGARRPDCVDV